MWTVKRSTLIATRPESMWTLTPYHVIQELGEFMECFTTDPTAEIFADASNGIARKLGSQVIGRGIICVGKNFERQPLSCVNAKTGGVFCGLRVYLDDLGGSDLPATKQLEQIDFMLAPLLEHMSSNDHMVCACHRAYASNKPNDHETVANDHHVVYLHNFIPKIVGRPQPCCTAAVNKGRTHSLAIRWLNNHSRK